MKVTKFHRQRVIRALSELGYAVDLSTQLVTILRNTSFPFSRIALPNTEVISLELIKQYAADHGIDLHALQEKMSA